MAKERLKSPRTRLFVALDIPEGVRARLAAWGERELTDPALRPVPPRSIHVTLVFLGWTYERDIPRVASLVHEGEGEAPRIQLAREPLPRPPGRRDTRLFALDAASPGAIAMQSDLAARLELAGFYKPEKRPFWPHLTVARVRKVKRGSNRYQRVERLPGPLPDELLEPFSAVRLTLYRSTLRSQGAEYLALAQNELPQGAAAR